jgi:hypothetical protein
VACFPTLWGFFFCLNFFIDFHHFYEWVTFCLNFELRAYTRMYQYALFFHINTYLKTHDVKTLKTHVHMGRYITLLDRGRPSPNIW